MSETVMRLVRFVVLVLAAVPFLPGCERQDNNQNLLIVTGAVELDGAPLSGGQVIFIPLDGNSSPEAGIISKSGTFEFPSKGGPMRVEITNTVENPDGFASNRIPERYNMKTELTADVSETNHHFEFKLTGKK